jgi:hypothetical protein
MRLFCNSGRQKLPAIIKLLNSAFHAGINKTATTTIDLSASVYPQSTLLKDHTNQQLQNQKTYQNGTN